MASISLPSTPKPTPVPKPAPDESRTPGKWRHPHLDEIVRRQNATTFGDQNIRKLLWNGAALAATWVFGNTLRSYTRRLPTIIESPAYSDLPLLILRLFFVLNILVALFPLFRPKDDLSDIPLTPTQRSLLGLDPTATPPLTPGSTYVTPPRYRLSASRTASPASRSASPLSTSANLSTRKASSSTPFSPSTSPLFYKVVSNGNKENGRRESFGSSSPLGRSSPFKESTVSTFGQSTMSSLGQSTMSSLGPASPSPAGGKRVSLGLSNKWLYERSSRRLSTSNGTL